MPRSLRGAAPAFAAALFALSVVPASAAELFDPRAFFSGRTEATGTLKIVFRGPETVRVEGDGRVESDGSLSLTQVVREGDKPARTRVWRLRETAPGRYTGTLTEAQGPVTADVSGDRLHITFTSHDGYGYEQWVTLAADGRSAHTVLKIRKLGFTVANYDETIRKLD